MSPEIPTDNAALAAQVVHVPPMRPTLSESSTSYRLAFEDPDWKTAMVR